MKKIIFFLALTLTTSIHAFAGSYGISSVNTFTEWKTDCYKPSKPYFYISDVNSYNMAVEEFNNYVSEVKTYLQSIQNEGESDTRTLLRAVENGINSESGEALQELDSVKSDLLMHKLYIQ